MRDYKVYARHGTEGWLRDLLFLLALFSAPFLSSLGRLPLFGPYEGRYAEISREMLERGDLITPTFNHVASFEKPPLLYWIDAASLKFFGQSEFAARLPSALCGLLALPVVYLIARRLYDRRTALLSAIILGCSTGFVLLSRTIVTDLPLCLCLTVALGTFIVIAQRDEGPRASPAPWYPFYLFCSLALLAGGVTGIILPAGILLLYLLLTGRWELVPRMRCGSGLLLFLGVAAPWFLAVSLRNPEFSRLFFEQTHPGRYGSSWADIHRPFWLFVPLLAVAMLPWSCYVPAALAKAWREQGREAGRPGLFLLIWVAAVLLSFSVSRSRLIPSLLPAFPPLAILVAHHVKGELERRGRGLKSTTAILGAVLVGIGVAALGYSLLSPAATGLARHLPGQAHALKRFAESLPSLSPFACVPVAGLLLFQGVTALSISGRRTGRALVVLCLCSFALEIIVPRLIMGTVARTGSARELALKAAQLAGADTAIVTVGPLPEVPWYTGRRVVVAGEREYDSRPGDQSAWFPTREALLGLWSGGTPLLVILGKVELDALRPVLRPAPRMLMESGRRLLISNR